MLSSRPGRGASRPFLYGVGVGLGTHGLGLGLVRGTHGLGHGFGTGNTVKVNLKATFVNSLSSSLTYLLHNVEKPTY
jgi:hypothetical protein